MADQNVPPLTDYLADALIHRSDELVDDWLQWLTERIGLRPVRSLPREAVLDHIPPVIRSIAEFLRTPVEAVKTKVEGDLRIHARLRYDQGYDIEELLAEYDALERSVSGAMLDVLETYPGEPDPVEAARLFLRLRQGLAAMTNITVSTYRRTELEHRRELHRELEEYVRTVSHELKNPLQSVTAGVSMLEEKGDAADADERRSYMEMIRTGVDRVLNLIEDIRMLALSEGAQETEEWQPLDDIVEAVLREVQGLAREKDVRVEVEGALPRIEVDPTRVELALINLVANAVKYSDPDKDDRWVRLAAKHSEEKGVDRWRIEVADNGLGIPEAEQSQVFDRHFRAHPRTAEGTGLGLSITRQAVEQLGGDIGFDSEEGRGSTFYIVVPGIEAGTSELEEAAD